MLTLHYADYIVFGVLLLISALVGPFYMWRERSRLATSESYFVGNRGLHIIPTAASLFASFWSAIALVGIPAELYTGGAKFFMASVGQAIGIVIAAFVAVPVIYNLKLISSFKYFELRFESIFLRKIGTIANILSYACYLAIVTYAPCTALEAVSDIPLWASVSAIAAITMLYTVLGGIKAVVLVDLIQAVVMFAGVIVAIAIGYAKMPGGFTRVMEIAHDGGRLEFFDFNPELTNTYNFWVMVLPPILSTAGVYATSQAAVQRYSALPSVKQAMWSVMSLAPQIMVLKLLLFFLALIMFAHYDHQGCDPLRGGLIKNANQLTTFYMADVLHYPGLVGLWFAALFSGSLSSMSTGYNSVAACIWEDLLKHSLQHRLSKRGVSIVLKLITLGLGVFTCVLSLLFKMLNAGSVVKLANSTISVFGAAIYIAFFNGALFPFVNSIGTIIGMIVATAMILFVASGQMYYGFAKHQVWLPTKTDNCTDMIKTMIEAGKWKIDPSKDTAKAVTTGLLLLSSTAMTPIQSPANSSNITSLMLAPMPIGGSGLSPTSSPTVFSNNYSNMSVENDSQIVSVEPTIVATTPAPFFTNVSDFDLLNLTNSSTVKLSTRLHPAFQYIFSISYFAFPFLSLMAGVLVAVLVSLISGGLDAAKFINPKYLIVPNCFYAGELERSQEVWALQEDALQDDFNNADQMPQKYSPVNQNDADFDDDTKDGSRELLGNNGSPPSYYGESFSPQANPLYTTTP